MIAHQTELSHMGNEPSTKTQPGIFVVVVLLLFIVGWVVTYYRQKPETITAERKYETFDDFTQKKEDGTYELRSSRKDKLNSDIKRMRENAEQYVLLAKSDGYYQCLHCPRGTFYLYAGEVAKVGTTIQGEDRYDGNWLNRMNLQYAVEFRGNVQQVLEREKIRIGMYPLTEENLARPDQPEEGIDRYKLARPVLNTKDF